MTSHDHKVSAEELDSVSGEPLPDREAMSILPIDPSGSAFPLPVEPLTEAQGGDETLPVEPPVES